MPAFLVTATILVEADDEVRASRKALAKILMEPSIALDVQSDGEHHARVIIQGVERQELIREAGLIDKTNEDRTS